MGTRADVESGTGQLSRAGLTPREREVFWLVADRLRNREVAESLVISERTVENHVASLLRKLGESDRTGLVAVGTRLREPRADVLPRFLSSFVGRDTEVAEVTRLVLDHRLVTLSGPAGVGKSRMALQVARSVTGMPPPILVDLATVTAGSEVDRAFSNALGLVEDDRGLLPALRDALRGGHHWLVVDNCEHVLGRCAALLGDLLSAAAELRVLATSRSPLHVAGEVVREIEPLGLPPDSDDPAVVLDGSSGRLFADRAATASPGFAITEDNARDVAALCRRLDGLPLAIELAAARIRTFSPAELVSHLDERFQLLEDGSLAGAGRHRTLEAALRWSYDLLDDEELLVFERCSVFPGEFDYSTAADVVIFPPLEQSDFLGAFTRLLDRSLLSSRRLGDQTTTYRMLDSFRAFGRQQLAAREESEDVSRRHARHHIDRAVATVPDLKGGDQRAALRWFDLRWTDLRVAMQWSLATGDVDQAWKLLGGIGRGWDVIGLRGGLSEWLDELLERELPPGDLGWRAKITAAFLLCFTDAARAARLAAEASAGAPVTDPGARAIARLNLGWALSYLGQAEEATGHLHAAASQFQQLNDPWHEALALQGLGSAAQEVEAMIGYVERSARIFARLHDDVLRANCMTFMAGRALEMGEHIDDVRGWLDQAYELTARSGNTHERLHAELNDARLSQHRGDHAGAATAFAELLPSLRRIGDQRCASRCLLGLGLAAMTAGDDATAGDHLTACVTLADRVKDPRGVAVGLRLLSGIEERAGHTLRAARLLGAADAAADRLDPARRNALPSDRELREQIRQRIAGGELESALKEGYDTPPTELLAA